MHFILPRPEHGSRDVVHGTMPGYGLQGPEVGAGFPGGAREFVLQRVQADLETHPGSH